MSELHYTYRVEWSPEDDEWVGLVAEFPSLSWLDPDLVEAMRGIRDLVESVVDDMRQTGETPPEPLAERRYSGKVFVRTSPELHRRLTIEAAEQGVSVNQWAMQKLAERRGHALGDPTARLQEAVLKAFYDAGLPNPTARLQEAVLEALHDAGLPELPAGPPLANFIMGVTEPSLVAALREVLAQLPALLPEENDPESGEHGRDYALGR